MKKIEQLYAIKLMSLSNFSGFYLFIFLQFLSILCKNVVFEVKGYEKLLKNGLRASKLNEPTGRNKAIFCVPSC